MGGSSQPTQTSSSTSRSGPWGPQQQYLNQLFRGASDIFSQGPMQYYPGQSFVGPSQYTQQGIQGLANMPNVRNDPLYGMATGYIGNQMNQSPDISGVQGYLGNVMNRPAPMPERYGTQYGYGYQAGGPAYSQGGAGQSFQNAMGQMGGPGPNPMQGNPAALGSLGGMNRGSGKGGAAGALSGPTQGGMARPSYLDMTTQRLQPQRVQTGRIGTNSGPAARWAANNVVMDAGGQPTSGFGRLSPMAQMWEMARHRGGR